jgi:hypothetical protein
MIVARKRDTGLTQEQAEHLATELKPFLDRFGGNQTRMAKAWGVSQPQLNQILNASGRGAGVAVLCRLRQATGRSIDDLLGLDPIGPSVDDRIRVVVENVVGSRIQGIQDAVVEALDKLESTKAPSSLPPAGPSRPRLLKGKQ